jgi:ABC-2 type transport system permease protein
MRLIRLALLYFRVGALNELQYRVNFFVQLFQSLVALVVGLVGQALVFSHTPDLNGWTRPELLAVMGVHILMGGLINAIIQPNMQRLLGDIQEGTFDYALTKPADAQVLASIREFRVWQIVDVAMGLIVVAVAAFQLQRAISLWQAAAFLFVLLLGWAMLYSVWLMVTATAFWIIRVEQIVNLFEGIYATGRWPVSVYPDWLRSSLTFIVPVAFAVTVPAEAITGRLTLPTLLGALALAVVMLALARWVWRRGLRAYSGASA